MRTAPQSQQGRSDTASGGIGRDIALCVWFIVAGIGFFAPYLGLALPLDLTAVYAVFLLAAIALLGLRLLQGMRQNGLPADRETVADGTTHT